MKQKDIKEKQQVTTVRVNSTKWRNFRTVCLTQGGARAAEVLEDIIEEYTMEHAKEAGDHLRKVAKRIEASVSNG